MEKVRIDFINGGLVKETIEAEQNGSCFIVDEKPELPEFDTVVVNENDGDREIVNPQVIECASVDGRYWFSISEIPAEVIAQEKMDAQVLYTALVTDTLLEEE